MSINGQIVVDRFYDLKAPINPVYSDCIENLIDSGIYSEYLVNGDAVNHKIDGNILQYKNGNGTLSAAVPLESIVDAITKSILVGLRDGLVGSVDSAVNISFENTSDNLNLSKANNVHSAIISLANELALIRTTLSSLLVEPAYSSSLAAMTDAQIIKDDLTKHKL
jgi:hypothetical protein